MNAFRTRILLLFSTGQPASILTLAESLSFLLVTQDVKNSMGYAFICPSGHWSQRRILLFQVFLNNPTSHGKFQHPRHGSWLYHVCPFPRAKAATRKWRQNSKLQDQFYLGPWDSKVPCQILFCSKVEVEGPHCLPSNCAYRFICSTSESFQIKYSLCVLDDLTLS